MSDAKQTLSSKETAVVNRWHDELRAQLPRFSLDLVAMVYEFAVMATEELQAQLQALIADGETRWNNSLVPLSCVISFEMLHPVTLGHLQHESTPVVQKNATGNTSQDLVSAVSAMMQGRFLFTGNTNAMSAYPPRRLSAAVLYKSSFVLDVRHKMTCLEWTIHESSTFKATADSMDTDDPIVSASVPHMSRLPASVKSICCCGVLQHQLVTAIYTFCPNAFRSISVHFVHERGEWERVNVL